MKALNLLLLVSFVLNPLAALADCKYDAIRIEKKSDGQANYAFCNGASQTCDPSTLRNTVEFEQLLLKYRESEGFKYLGKAFLVSMSGMTVGSIMLESTDFNRNMKIIEYPPNERVTFAQVLEEERKALRGEKILIKEARPRVLKLAQAPFRYLKGYAGLALAVAGVGYLLADVMKGAFESHQFDNMLVQLRSEGLHGSPLCLDPLQAQTIQK